MSHVIDSRVVEMQFDNAKFAKNCDDTMKQLDDLDRTLSKTATGADFSAAEKALINLGRQGTESAGEVADSLSHLESRFSAWGTFCEEVIKKVADGFVNLAEKAATALIDATTLGAMKDGLAEYNLLMESMQSMSVLTGKSTEEINNMFDKLNAYADKTKYSFADMTRNLSMFAASGASLDEMEISMEGIANWMAAVGAPASDMSRIIYNIGQAFSKGYLQLIDWKSIENSKGMNGQQFVKVFVDQAYALGKMSGEQYAEAMASAAEGNLSGWFREAISGKDAFKGFDKDVMLATFKEFAENPVYMKAATQLKTFSEFLDNVKEEMGSGWQQTWRNVIGDLDVATKLFKGLKDTLTEYWDLGGEARNQLIEDFNDLGGSGQAYSILTNMLKIVGELKNAFMSGLAPNFKEITGYDIWKKSLEIATALRHTLDDIKEGNTATDVFERLGDAVGVAFDGIARLLNGFRELGSVNSEGLGQVAMKLGDIAYALSNRLFGSIGKIGDKISELSKGPLTDIVSDIGAIAYAFLDLTEFAVNSGFIGKAFNSIWKAMEDYLEAIGIVKEGMSGLGEAVDDVHTRFINWIQEINAKSESGSFVEYLTDSILGLDVKLFDVIEVLKGLKTEWNDCWEAVHEGDWTRFSTFIKEDLLPALEGLFDFKFEDILAKLQDIAFWRPDVSQFVSDMQQIWGQFEFGEDILETIKNLLESLAETFVSFWHRISSTGFFGNTFTDLKEQLGLDDTEPFKLDALKKVFDFFTKGSKDVEDASVRIEKSVHTIKKAFSGPNVQTVKMQTLSLDDTMPADVEEQLSFWEKLKSKFSTYWEYVKDIDINEDGIARWLKLFGGLAVVKVLKTLAEAFKNFVDNGASLIKKFDPWTEIPKTLNNVLGGIVKTLNSYSDKLAAESFATKWKQIGITFGIIVGAVAIFAGLDYLGVDVMGNAMVVLSLFGVLALIMDKAMSFAGSMQALDSVAIAAACIGFGSMIKNMTLCVAALTLLAKEWGEMDSSQLLQIFGYFALIIGTAEITLTAAGKMMAGMMTGIEWAVMYVVLAAIGKLFKTMALTLAELTLLEKFLGDNTRTAMMDLLAIWGMIELLVTTIMGFSAKIGASGTGVLQAAAVLLVVKHLFSTMGIVLGELALISYLPTAGNALLQLVGIFAMIEALMWSAAGCAQICTQTGLIPGLATLAATADQFGDLILALGLVTAAFALIGSDKIKTALGELAIVLGEMILTLTAFSAINKFLNGGVTLNVAGLVFLVGSMAAVVAALALFAAATVDASPEQINASLEAFDSMISTLGIVFGAMVVVAAGAAAAQQYGAIFLGAIAVLAGVWVAVGAAALEAGVAALAFGKSIDLLVDAMQKFTTIDTETLKAKGEDILEWMAVKIPEGIIKGMVNLIVGFKSIRDQVAVQLAATAAETIGALAVTVPQIIAATDKYIAAGVAQLTLDLTKYGPLLLAAITADLYTLGDMLQESSGIITAMGHVGRSLAHMLIESFLGETTADKIMPVSQGLATELVKAVQGKINEYSDAGEFAMNAVFTGMEKKADEGKYSIFSKGKDAADSYGQGLISSEDILAQFGLQMGTQAGNSLASEEVQSVYNRAGISNSTAYSSAFMSPEMQSLMEQFGISNGGMLGSENVLSAFTASGMADMGAYYQQMFDANPELQAQLEAAGIDTGALLSSETIKNTFGESGKADIEEFNAQQQAQLRTQRPEMVAYAAKEVEAYYQGRDVKDSANKSGKEIASNVKAGMSSKEAQDSMDQGGAYLIQGAQNGMNREANRSGGIIDSARSIANSISNMFRRSWNEHSPSRVADEIGAFFGMGLNNGLVREGTVAVESARTVAEDISEAFTDLSYDGFNDGVITITPEVDLSNVESAARRTSDMFNRNKSLSMSAQYAFAGTDATGFGDTYNITVNETDANNGFSVGRDLERYLMRRY
jgi:hypothetical protein